MPDLVERALTAHPGTVAWLLPVLLAAVLLLLAWWGLTALLLLLERCWRVWQARRLRQRTHGPRLRSTDYPGTRGR